MNPRLCNGCGQNNSTAAAYRKKKLLKSNSDICFKNTLLELTFTETQITYCVSTAGCATILVLFIIIIITIITKNTRPTAFKRVGESCVMMNVNQRKHMEIILNSYKVPRQPCKKLRNLPHMKERKTLFKLISESDHAKRKG